MCKRNSSNKEISTGCVRETPQGKKEKEKKEKKASTGCVRDITQIKMKAVWDV